MMGTGGRSLLECVLVEPNIPSFHYSSPPNRVRCYMPLRGLLAALFHKAKVLPKTVFRGSVGQWICL